MQTPDEVRRLPEDTQFLIFRGMHPIHTWRPPYWNWTIFPSLPDYTLGEVFGTLGRNPRNKAEQLRFTAWKQKPLLMGARAASRRGSPGTARARPGAGD